MQASIQSRVVLPSGWLEIDHHNRSALTLENIRLLFPDADDSIPPGSDSPERAEAICEILRNRSQIEGSHAHLFLLLYFHRAIHNLKSGAALNSVLLPLANARFCSADEKTSLLVDFAFWTGRRFVAVFVCTSPNEPDWSGRQKILKSWGFEVIRLMAEELETRGLIGETGMKIWQAAQPAVDSTAMPPLNVHR